MLFTWAPQAQILDQLIAQFVDRSNRSSPTLYFGRGFEFRWARVNLSLALAMFNI